jgi:hypothetical protein
MKTWLLIIIFSARGFSLDVKTALDAFLGTDDFNSYLLGSTVWKNSWSWATFVDKEYLSIYGTPSDFESLKQFEIIFIENNMVMLKCELGHQSYLAHKPLGRHGWQWAFFASKEYLEKGSYISEFRLEKTKTGISLKSDLALLVFDSANKGNAFFATQKYIDSSEKKYFTSFKINDASLELDF